MTSRSAGVFKKNITDSSCFYQVVESEEKCHGMDVFTTLLFQSPCLLNCPKHYITFYNLLPVKPWKTVLSIPF